VSRFRSAAYATLALLAFAALIWFTPARALLWVAVAAVAGVLWWAVYLLLRRM
jgi:hypothetical protein